MDDRESIVSTFRQIRCVWTINLTGRQIAAARALLGMSQSELAERSNLSVPTVKRMEGSAGAAPGMVNNLAAVRTALEAAGALFLAENGEGPGVRLRKVTP